MRRLLSALLLASSLVAPTSAVVAEPTYGIAMHGSPALPADFAHFPYVNPDAPKGGRIDYAIQGSFDSLNPFIVKGDATRGLFDQFLGNNVFDTLLARSRDEAFTLYPLLAQKVETDAERNFIEFTLDPRARFSDGQPVTPDDVIFSMQLFQDKARPLYQRWIKVVDRMEKVGDLGVRFTFKPEADREAPLLLALLPILPRHATDAENFDKSSLTPIIASGPYRIDSVRPGEVVVLKRNPDYWAKDIPSKIGFDNYDEIRINYFRDENSMFEAFKKGVIDVQLEADTSRWAGGYNFPAATDGRIVKDTFKTGLPSGMFGFVMNTRREVFKDRAVRAALAGLFDFEWANKNLFSGGYKRTHSFYDGSELSSSGRPASDAEKALLTAAGASIPQDMMEGTWAPPVSDATGRDRTFLKKGFDALRAAGFQLKDGKLVGKDGRQLAFEVLVNGKSGEAISSAWQRTLEKLGVGVSIRSVDSAQYLTRQQTYDYDVIIQTYTASLSPGGEQVGRWGSASRNAPGSYNFAGVADPAIDKLIDSFTSATSREDFVTGVRAYDRLLLSGFYVVPLYYQPEQWVARWARIQHPEKSPIYGYQLPTWWRSDK